MSNPHENSYWTTAVTGAVSARLGGASGVGGAAGGGASGSAGLSSDFLAAAVSFCCMRRVSSFWRSAATNV